MTGFAPGSAGRSGSILGITEGIREGRGDTMLRPTAAPAPALGITHAGRAPGALRREDRLRDEISIRKRIHLHKGDAA